MNKAQISLTLAQPPQIPNNRAILRRFCGDSCSAAIGQWLDLFNQHPHRVLTCKDPYEAIQNLVNGKAILSVGRLYDKYLEWAEGYFPPL